MSMGSIRRGPSTSLAMWRSFATCRAWSIGRNLTTITTIMWAASAFSSFRMGLVNFRVWVFVYIHRCCWWWRENNSAFFFFAPSCLLFTLMGYICASDAFSSLFISFFSFLRGRGGLWLVWVGFLACGWNLLQSIENFSWGVIFFSFLEGSGMGLFSFFFFFQNFCSEVVGFWWGGKGWQGKVMGQPPDLEGVPLIPRRKRGKVSWKWIRERESESGQVVLLRSEFVRRGLCMHWLPTLPFSSACSPGYNRSQSRLSLSLSAHHVMRERQSPARLVRLGWLVWAK